MKTVGETATVKLLIISTVASIAMIPMIIYGCVPEWARWDATQANMFFRLGETDDALYQLRDAVRKSPRDPVLKLTLAERLIEANQPKDALDLADEVLAVYPNNANAIKIKSLSQQTQGNFADALETQLEYDKKLHASNRGTLSLNDLAYFRALAGKELHLAKRDIEGVVVAANRRVNWKGSEGLTYPVKATVLASLVSRCCDMQKEALWTISQQIDVLQKKIANAQIELTRDTYEAAQGSLPIRQNDVTVRRQRLRRYETHAAVLLSCRALIHQDLGDPISCQADRVEVVHLGYDSAELAANFPTDKAALMSLSSAGAFLDTRGYVSGLLPWFKESQHLEPNSNQHNFLSSYSNAILDVNVAILCVEADRKSFNCSLRNAVEFVEDRTETQKLMKRQEAVLRYHRYVIHERAGNLELAKVDAKKIRELGFEPGIHLF